jgi:hypothetical protein
VGVVKSLGLIGAGPVGLVHAQKIPIKYKNPPPGLSVATGILTASKIRGSKSCITGGLARVPALPFRRPNHAIAAPFVD